jgi:hypothetical protein
MQAGGGSKDERNEEEWHWTVLLRVNKEMHDEVTSLVYCGMELCLLLTTDETLDKNHNAFSRPGELDPVIENLLSPDNKVSLFSNTTTLQDYQMQLMLLEQLNKRRKRQQSNANHAPAPSSASHHSSASTQFSSSTQSSLVQAGPSTQPQTQTLTTTPIRPSPIPPNIVVPPGQMVFQAPLQPFVEQHPWVSDMSQRIRIQDRQYAEREVGIFLPYFMHVERDAWLNEACMGWEDERKARIVQICHVPVFVPQRPSQITFLKPPKNLEPTVAARYMGMIRKVRLVMDVVDLTVEAAQIGVAERFWSVVNDEKETACTLALAVWDVLECLSSKKEFSGCEVVIEMHIVGFERLGSREKVLDAVRLLLKPFELCAGKLNVSLKSLVTLDQPLNKNRQKVVLVRDGALTDELNGSDDQASQRLADYLKEWQTKVNGKVWVEADKHWKFPGEVKACRSLEEGLCDVFGSCYAADWRLRKLGVLSFQAKMAIAEGNFDVFRETWGHILSLLCEIDGELENQTGGKMGLQYCLKQSPRQIVNSRQRKELGQGQKTKEQLRNKLSKLMVRAQAMLKGHGHNADRVLVSSDIALGSVDGLACGCCIWGVASLRK